MVIVFEGRRGYCLRNSQAQVQLLEPTVSELKRNEIRRARSFPYLKAYNIHRRGNGLGIV